MVPSQLLRIQTLITHKCKQKYSFQQASLSLGKHEFHFPSPFASTCLRKALPNLPRACFGCDSSKSVTAAMKFATFLITPSSSLRNKVLGCWWVKQPQKQSLTSASTKGVEVSWRLEGRSDGVHFCGEITGRGWGSSPKL